MDKHKKEYVLMRFFRNQEIDSKSYSTYNEADKAFEEHTGLSYKQFRLLRGCCPLLVKDFEGSKVLSCVLRVIQ